MEWIPLTCPFCGKTSYAGNPDRVEWTCPFCRKLMSVSTAAVPVENLSNATSGDVLNLKVPVSS